ncbi:unnamed protein product, partial [Amoebophrya sp. A25]
DAKPHDLQTKLVNLATTEEVANLKERFAKLPADSDSGFVFEKDAEVDKVYDAAAALVAGGTEDMNFSEIFREVSKKPTFQAVALFDAATWNAMECDDEVCKQFRPEQTGKRRELRMWLPTEQGGGDLDAQGFLSAAKALAVAAHIAQDDLTLPFYPSQAIHVLQAQIRKFDNDKDEMSQVTTIMKRVKLEDFEEARTTTVAVPQGGGEG